MKKLMFVLMVLASANAGAALNKWIDANGKVHYSDQPPVGVEATPVRAAPSPAVAPAAPKSYTEREAELKKARQSQNEAAGKAAQEQSNAEIEKANCNAAQQALRSLQQGGRIVEYDDSGERRYVEDSERQQRADKAQAEISKWCK